MEQLIITSLPEGYKWYMNGISINDVPRSKPSPKASEIFHGWFPSHIWSQRPPAWASSKAKRPVVFSSLLTWCQDGIKVKSWWKGKVAGNLWVWGQKNARHVGFPVIFATTCLLIQRGSLQENKNYPWVGVMKCDQPACRIYANVDGSDLGSPKKGIVDTTQKEI